MSSVGTEATPGERESLGRAALTQAVLPTTVLTEMSLKPTENNFPLSMKKIPCDGISVFTV